MSRNLAEGAWSLRPVDGDVLPIPWLWLGGWSLGGEGFGPHDEREARRTVEYALYAGIRHFDTAGFYAQGRSEALLAKVLRKQRTCVFLSSKGGLVREGARVRHDATPGGLRAALDESLRRLNTDYLDLFQLHWPDPGVPIAESLDALRQFQDEGWIRRWGVGNLSASEVTALLEPGMAVPHQVHFNPLQAAHAVTQAGYLERHCINCAISPLEQGLLTDGPASDGLKRLGKSDVRHRNPRFRSEKVMAWVAAFQSLADATGLPRAAVVLLWILHHRELDIAIVGARTARQLEQILQHRSVLRCLELGAPQGGRSGWQEALKRELGEPLWIHLNQSPTGDHAGF